MKRLLLISIFSINLIACHSSNEKGVKHKIDAQTGYVIQEMIVSNININYTVNKQGDTAKIWTQDQNFLTSEGFKVGTTWKELPSELQKSVYKLPGWGYFVELKSGWRLGFCEGQTCTDKPPMGMSKVAWIERIKK
jgi:hypothetical protein